MADVLCSRCYKKTKAMNEAPLPDELGQKVLLQTCEKCWGDWVAQQLMLMNEYHLDPLNEEHSKFLDNEMIKYLNLK